ncbi:MAG: ShlB/FhaC/HecB family hemolysin secretion/activation protein [Leptolyngbyaceae cyanobacterium]
MVSPRFDRCWLALLLWAGIPSLALANSQSPLPIATWQSGDKIQMAPVRVSKDPGIQGQTASTLATANAPQSLAQAAPTDGSFTLTQIEVLGSTVFTPDTWQVLIAPLLGEPITLAQLQDLTDAITQRYAEAGYLNSTARLPPQALTDGVARIEVIEGRLASIEVTGAERLSPDYIRDRLHQNLTTPLQFTDLDDAIRLLQQDPLFAEVQAQFRAGAEPGEGILAVTVVEASPWSAEFSVDNYSPPSIGSERVGTTVGYGNLTGAGDRLAVTYQHTRGLNRVDLDYTYPLSGQNNTVSASLGLIRSRVIQAPFDSLGIRADANVYELQYRHPLTRTYREEFALSVGLRHRNGQTFLFNDLGTPFGAGAETDGTTRTTVITLGQDYLHRDASGAWAARSQLNLGTDWFDATVNDAPTPSGSFFSWLFQLQRVQRLSESHLLLLGLDLQLAGDPLLASEAFYIGGGQSLRGYRQNVRGGDNGLRLSVEDRITLNRRDNGAATLQLAPFFDVGTVWNHPDNPTALPSQSFLAGLGLGVIWSPVERLTVRLDGAIPLVNLSDRGDNLQEESLYFSVNYGL